MMNLYEPEDPMGFSYAQRANDLILSSIHVFNYLHFGTNISFCKNNEF